MGEFLRARRAALNPVDVGVVSYGQRRVSGLRREEIALLAGLSVTYYTRLEQGHSRNASESVIAALANALRLDDVERGHLFDLARVPRAKLAPRGEPDLARLGTVRLLESMTEIPAVLLGKRTEILAWNGLGRELVGWYLPVDAPGRPSCRPNLTRMLFLDAETRALYTDWRGEASRAVASLRLLSGRFADDPELSALVGELTLNSSDFAAMWSQHPVGNCMSGVKFMQHPRAGELELDFEVLSMPDHSGHRMLTYTAAPGSVFVDRVAALRLPADVTPPTAGG